MFQPCRTWRFLVTRLCMPCPSSQVSLLLLEAWISISLGPSSSVSLKGLWLLSQPIGCSVLSRSLLQCLLSFRYTKSKTSGQGQGRGHGLVAEITKRWRYWVIALSWGILLPTWFFFVFMVFLDEKFVISKLSQRNRTVTVAHSEHGWFKIPLIVLSHFLQLKIPPHTQRTWKEHVTHLSPSSTHASNLVLALDTWHPNTSAFFGLYFISWSINPLRAGPGVHDHPVEAP